MIRLVIIVQIITILSRNKVRVFPVENQCGFISGVGLTDGHVRIYGRVFIVIVVRRPMAVYYLRQP